MPFTVLHLLRTNFQVQPKHFGFLYEGVIKGIKIRAEIKKNIIQG